ncbi:MAG: hypothetical protein Q4E57_05545 [Eubacteriales bacterium]|nr:hypothetical protein [Eubacteriales bacterium]
MANCPNCGGMLRYDIPSGMLSCANCRSMLDPYEHDKVNEAEELKSGETGAGEFRVGETGAGEHQAGETDTFGVTVFTCPNCGGEVYSSDSDLTGSCSFCGSPVVFKTRMSREKRPAYIIPFKKTREDCIKIYEESLKGKLFAPNALTGRGGSAEFRGIYMPYWIYDVKQSGTFDIQVTKERDKGLDTYIDTYEFTIDNDSEYYQLAHDASEQFFDNLSERIEPYEFIAPEDAVAANDGNYPVDCKIEVSPKETLLKPFSPSFLTGFYAEPCDVGADTYKEYAKDLSGSLTASYADNAPQFEGYNMSLHGGGDEYFHSKVAHSSLALLPVWFLSYKNDGRVAYAAVNGQTGKLVFDVPLSMYKVLRAIIIAAVPIFVILKAISLTPALAAFAVTLLSFAINISLFSDLCYMAEKFAGNAPDGRRENKLSGSSFLGIGVVLIVIALLLIFKFMGIFDEDYIWVTSYWARAVYSVVFAAGSIIGAHICRPLETQLKEAGIKLHLPVLIPVITSICGVLLLIIRPAEPIYFAVLAIMSVLLFIAMLSMVRTYNYTTTQPEPQLTIHRGNKMAE